MTKQALRQHLKTIVSKLNQKKVEKKIKKCKIRI